MAKKKLPKPHPDNCVIIHRHTPKGFKLAVCKNGSYTSSYKRHWGWKALPETLTEVYQCVIKLIEDNQLTGFPIWFWIMDSGWLDFSDDANRIQYVLSYDQA